MVTWEHPPSFCPGRMLKAANPPGTGFVFGINQGLRPFNDQYYADEAAKVEILAFRTYKIIGFSEFNTACIYKTKELRPGDALLFQRLFAFIRRGRDCRLFLIVFQFIQHHFDGFVELVVNALVFAAGIVVHFYIRFHSVSFHDPFAFFGRIGGKFRLAKVGSIYKRQGTSDADYSAPTAHPDHFSQLVLLESIGEQVAVEAE